MHSKLISHEIREDIGMIRCEPSALLPPMFYEPIVHLNSFLVLYKEEKHIQFDKSHVPYETRIIKIIYKFIFSHETVHQCSISLSYISSWT